MTHDPNADTSADSNATDSRNSSQATRTALVTGASSGIGAELAKQFAADGYDLVVSARREDRLIDLGETLESAYGVSTTVVTADLSDPGAPRRLFEAVREEVGFVHTLVNNAGFSTHGRFDETDLEAERDMIQLNVTAVTELTKLFVRPMVERGDGAILNTASMAGLAPTPSTAAYGGTKAYVRSFSEAIAHEFEDEGITVTALCPGPVDTEFIEVAGMDDATVSEGPMNDPESVARAGYEGLKAGKRIVVPSTRMKVLTQLSRFLPRKRIVSMAADTVDEGV